MKTKSQRELRSQGRRSNRSDQFAVDSSSQSHEKSQINDSQLQESIPQEHEQQIVATVKFVLNHLSTKLPIKRADIIKECCDGNSRSFAMILLSVQQQLKSIYGIIFQEVIASKGSNKQYVCFANNQSIVLQQLTKSNRKEMSLLFFVLSYIFVKGGSISEGVLLNYLGCLDISVEEEHPYFGDVKNTLEQFRKQLYIKQEKNTVESSNEEKVIVEWGERAVIEFDKKNLLIEVAQIFGKPTIYFKKLHTELMLKVKEDERMEVE